MKSTDAIKEIKDDMLRLKNYSMSVYDDELFEKVETELADKEKQDKAISIIKDKQIDFGAFMKAKNRKEYNQMVFYVKNELTKKEYDIVKEVIKP